MPFKARFHCSDDLRPSLEDQLGAGAVLACLEGTRSPEAAAAIAAFESAATGLPETLRNSASGKKLTGWGFEDDITVAAELNCDEVAPKLDGGAFRSSIRG